MQLTSFKALGDSPTIPPKRIIVPATVLFKQDGETKAMAFSIKDVAFPGTYDGEVKLKFENEAAILVPIRVNVYKPLKPLTVKEVIGCLENPVFGCVGCCSTHHKTQSKTYRPVCQVLFSKTFPPNEDTLRHRGLQGMNHAPAFK